MRIISDKFLEDNKHLTVSELIDKLKQKDKSNDEFLEESMNIDMKKKFEIGDSVLIPFYDIKNDTFELRNMVITDSRTSYEYHNTEKIWYELDNGIYISQEWLNRIVYYMNKNDHKSAYTFVTRSQIRIHIERIAEWMNVVNNYSVDEQFELGIWGGYSSSSSASSKLRSIHSILIKNFFYTHFKLDELIDEYRQIIEKEYDTINKKSI